MSVPAWQPPAMPYVEEALDARTVVVEEHGRWVVYFEVVLASGAVRRKIADHHDERRAVHHARIFERNATKHIKREGARPEPDPEVIRSTGTHNPKGEQ